MFLTIVTYKFETSLVINRHTKFVLVPIIASQPCEITGVSLLEKYPVVSFLC
jgi:hypothetical protein